MARMRKKKKISAMAKCRIILALLISLVIISVLGYNCLNNVLMIKEMKDEKVSLEEEIVSLEEEKESLELDIQRLQDPDYIAKYVREKYYYSKDGEIILKFD